jgi:hypothetical protein
MACSHVACDLSDQSLIPDDYDNVMPAKERFAQLILAMSARALLSDDLVIVQSGAEVRHAGHNWETSKDFESHLSDHLIKQHHNTILIKHKHHLLDLSTDGAYLLTESFPTS